MGGWERGREGGRVGGLSLSLEVTEVFKTHTCRYLDAIERAVSNGDCLFLENIGESVDAVLDPLLGRLTIKKGKYIKIGDREVEYHPSFRSVEGGGGGGGKRERKIGGREER